MIADDVVHQRRAIAPTYHVVLKVGTDDQFDLAVGAGERLLPLALDGAPADASAAMQAHIWDVLAPFALTPPPGAVDFYRIAAAVYAADLRVPRATSFDRWTRDIVLHVPVEDLRAWTRASEPLHRLLAFLTGDRWTVEFREQSVAVPQVARRYWGTSAPFAADGAALFSGGLDSAVGAVDDLAAGRALALVSHNSKGGDAFSSPSQRAVLEALHGAFPKERAHGFRFRLDPPAAVAGVTASETTTRSRSIIFFALGVLVASALDAGAIARGAPLVVPENGLISLNVPLTRARYGSWSTRTTHPHTIALLRQVLLAVGLDTPIETPYRFRTKGEMLTGTADPALARAVAGTTVSCGHPNQGRWLPRGRVVRADGTFRQHCGTCVPCIIRRAAMRHAGWDDPDDYWFRLPEELPSLGSDRASDARAFLVALADRRPATPAILLQSGPLPVEDEAELRALLRVYDAGMDEVKALLAPAAAD